jgi:hypothetical protein
MHPATAAFFNPDDVGIDEAQTAAILHVKVETLATWRSQGRGPRFRKTGRRIEYTPKFIREFQASCERTPEPASVRRQRRVAGDPHTA